MNFKFDPFGIFSNPYVAASSAASRPHLTYRGGKILQNPRFATLYLGNYWSGKSGRSDQKYFDSFEKSVIRSKYTSVWAQYGVGKGKFIGSAVDGSKPVPANVYDAYIQRTLANQFRQGTLPEPDGSTVYSVFLPPGAVLHSTDGSSSKNGLGGFHGSFTAENGKEAYYAALVYDDRTNGIDFNGNSRDDITITDSHELSEAVTDPDVAQATFDNGVLGWYDNKYGEVGDIPIDQNIPLGQVYGREGRYAVQKLWSEQDQTDEVAAITPGPVEEPTA